MPKYGKYAIQQNSKKIKKNKKEKKYIDILLINER